MDFSVLAFFIFVICVFRFFCLFLEIEKQGKDSSIDENTHRRPTPQCVLKLGGCRNSTSVFSQQSGTWEYSILVHQHPLAEFRGKNWRRCLSVLRGAWFFPKRNEVTWRFVTQQSWGDWRDVTDRRSLRGRHWASKVTEGSCPRGDVCLSVNEFFDSSWGA